MGMGGHETIRINLHPVAVFVFQKQVVIKLFGPIGFKKPIAVVALPRDMKGGTILDDGITRQTRHALNIKQSLCHLEIYLQRP
jgi:hypothetical protein